MGSSSLPCNTNHHHHSQSVAVRQTLKTYSRHFFFGFFASAGSEYLTRDPLTVLVSAAKLPDRPRLTPSFFIRSSDLLAESQLPDLDLLRLLDLELEVVFRLDTDLDLELLELLEDLDLDLENFPRLRLFFPFLRDLLLPDLDLVLLLRDLLLEPDLLLPDLARPPVLLLLRSLLFRLQCWENLFSACSSSSPPAASLNLSCFHFSPSPVFPAPARASTFTSSLRIFPVNLLCGLG